MASKNTTRKLSKKLGNSSLCPERRVREFPGETLYVSEGILFCKACSKRVTWCKKDTLSSHVHSKGHRANCASEKKKSQRQTTLGECSTRQENQKIVNDFVKVLCSSGLPIEVADAFKPFLKKYAPTGGAIPSASTLRKLYVPRVFEEHVQDLKDFLKGQFVSIVCDETTDAMDNSVFNIIAGK